VLPEEVGSRGGLSKRRRTRILVINDFVELGGAEVVYRRSLELLATIRDAEVEKFDNTTLHTSATRVSRIWNIAAARELNLLIERFQPDHVWVHNYHNNLSSSILPVIARLRRRMGFRAYLTCHDYFLVFYDPMMVYRSDASITPVPVEDLGSWRALVKRSSAQGSFHDITKKLHWHLVDSLVKPRSIFDVILCPSRFMQRVLNSCGICQAIYFPNPLSCDFAPMTRVQSSGDKLKLAFVGRIIRDKGIDGFVDLAQACGFPCIESLTVFGDGDERAALERKYEPLIESGKLIFAGRLPHQTLFSVLREHHGLVVPSIWYENAPLVVMEAGALGLPILARDIGSLTTFGNEIGNKILYQSTVEGLVTAMNKLLAHIRDPDLVYNLDDFAPDGYCQKLSEIFGLQTR
jgi:glycosyltransferase involved in cell wall biosynthesis